MWPSVWFWVLLAGQRGAWGQEACPLSCYCDLTSRYVHCEGDLSAAATALPQGVPRYAERLELRELRLGALRWEATRGAFPAALRELSVRKSDLSELANGSLGMLQHLGTLDLSHNALRAVQPGTLDTLTLLRHLDLGCNRLGDVRGLFVGLQNLETLNLSDNLLTALSSRTFAGLQRLQWLDLSDNRITSVEPGTFLPMQGLERLDLSRNPLQSLQRLEFLGSRLRYMDVSDLELQRVPESLGPSVRELRAAANHLSAVRRGDLESYPNLNLLDLSGNRLQVVEEDALGRLESLIRLCLSDNLLKAVPKSLPRSLTVLLLERNQVATLAKEDLAGLPKLRQLSLRGNLISQVDSVALNALSALRQLDLARNLLRSATLGPNGLEEVDLSDNRALAASAETVQHVPHLRTLTLANLTGAQFDLRLLLAPLTELSALNLAGSATLAAQLLQQQLWFSLREVNLQNCSLRDLPAALLGRKGKLRTLSLSLNPWNCTHDLLAALARRDARVHVSDAAALRCDSGEPLLANASVLQVSADPSLPPTRTQILAPTAVQPNATSKPQSTLPLVYAAAGPPGGQTGPHQTTKTPHVRRPASTFLKIAKLTEKMLKTDNRVLEKSRPPRPQRTTPSSPPATKPTEAGTTPEISSEALATEQTDHVTTTPTEKETTPTFPVETTPTSRVETTPTDAPAKSTPPYHVTSTERETTPISHETETKSGGTPSYATNTTPPPTIIVTSTEEGEDSFESGMIIVGGEEFYDEPLNRNYSEAQAAKLGLAEATASNVPVGLILCLSSLGVSTLLLLFVYHCRLKYKWAAVSRAEDEPLDLRVLNSYRDSALSYRSEYGPLDVRY